jgi:uncharacterized protein YecE (DUF72 family)
VIRIGLCGFTVSAREYFETWPVLEVQQTFYDPPDDRTLLRWREQSPEGFEFTMKAWQLITHRGTSNTYRRMKTPADLSECGSFAPTPTVMRGWERTRRCAEVLRATMILFQCPASFRPTEENVDNLRRFFTAIDRPARFLWEPRGDWPDVLLTELCAELELTHVVDPFLRPSVTTGLTYWRLHGIGSHRHVYTDDELRLLRSRVPAEGETYVMFNNIPRVRDAQRFARMVAEG